MGEMLTPPTTYDTPQLPRTAALEPDSELMRNVQGVGAGR